MISFIILFLLFVFTTDVTAAPNVPIQKQSESIRDLVLEEIMLDIYASLMSSNSEDHLFLPNSFDFITIPDQDVKFLLYTRENPDLPVMLRIGDIVSLSKSNFSIDFPTKILIHGWTDTISDSWMHDFRENYLSLGYYNVILVDWTAISSYDYLIATKLIKQVGDYVSLFLEFLVIKGVTTPDDVHILGHSLGAHIAGFIGENFVGQISRITGMDPARLGFEVPILREPKDRLDPSDALFVDVIHTCAGTIGFIRAIGHVDFYPNGGSFRQPGCPVLLTQYCSHGRSHEYMGESIINPTGFPALECDGWKEFESNMCDNSKNRVVYMGEKLEMNARGVYFLETNVKSPYGRGEL